ADNVVEVLCHYDASAESARGRCEAIELDRLMVRNRRFLRKRNSYVTGKNAVAAEFNLRHGYLIARVQNLNSTQLGVRLSGGVQQSVLPGIGLEPVDIVEFADNRVMRARLVTLARQVQNVAVHILGRIRCV